MNDKGPQLGQLITDGDRRRDAVHVAVAPVTAAMTLFAGQHVGLVWPENAEVVGRGAGITPIGVVDPFLTKPVLKNERCYVFLYPNTVTSLRHVWTHPAFTAAANALKEKLEANP